MKNNTHSTKRYLLWILIGLLAVFCLARIYYALTDDFRFGNITYEMPYHQEWAIQATPETEKLLETILDQPYHYIGKGAQSYVFGSADGQYVVKFFKFKHLRPSLFHDLLPAIGPLAAYKTKQAARKERKLFGVFASYKLAYDVDRKESGLVFIQLNVTGNPQRSIVVYDKLGLSHTIDLAEVPFIVQKRGVPLREVLKPLLEQGQVAEANAKIGLVFDMYAEEYKKGIYDHDHGVDRNVGFIGDQPIHLDVGKLYEEPKMKDPQQAKQDLMLVEKTIGVWVKKHYPDDYPAIKAYMDEKIERLYGP